MPGYPTSTPLRRPETGHPVPWLPWSASVLFLFGLLAVIATGLAVWLGRDTPMISMQVIDDDTGTALAGAVVTIDGVASVAGHDGRVSAAATGAPAELLVEFDGYLSKLGNVELPGETTSWVLSLRRETAMQTAPLDQDPANAGDTAAGSTEADTTESSSDLAVASAATPQAPVPDERMGMVTDEQGQPVQGALITDGTTARVTGADGVFALKTADFVTDALRVSAPGYADTTLSLAAPGSLAVTLQLQPVKAIYYNPNISNTPEDVDRLINLINTTEVNAIVIDVKEELIFYDSQVAFFRETDTIRPILDLPELLARLDEHDIYTIARHVVFKDGLVAEARPDLAVLNENTGEIWRDMNGVAWVNPMLHELWDANIALAVELAELGFDEIQYDYVRFPTDGDISTMDFGLPYTEENRVTSISKFLERSKAALLPTGAKLSADVFGFTTLVPDDLGIGQDITELVAHVDYLSPMVYPSHFPDGAMGLDGHPNDYPYETIEISMRNGRDQLGTALPLRPWLQDFDFWDMIPYGIAEVRAQIDAAEDVGTSGWMLWDPDNIYTVGALGPDDGNMSRFRAPQAVMPSRHLPSVAARMMAVTRDDCPARQARRSA